MIEDERISQIEKLASELRKCAYGAGGQCVGCQHRNVLKSNLGLKCLKAIKEYKDEIEKFFGGQNA